MAKRTKTLSQHQMYRIWDTMEDILMFIEGGEYELPRIENVEIGHGQPAEELRFWSDLLNKVYITEETKHEERSNSVNVDRRDDDEFNEYGLLMDSGCQDPVGFRD